MRDGHAAGTGSHWLFRLANGIAPLAALIGVASFVAVGILGFGKAGGWMTDFYWYYVGGLCFQRGSDMYDVACVGPTLLPYFNFKALAGVAYPPQFGPIALLVSLAPIFYATRLFLAFGILIALGMIAMVIRTERRVRQEAGMGRPLNHLWAVALVLGSSGLWGSVYLGQISLLVALCIWIAFRQLEKGHDVTAGVLLAIISIKPQIGLLLFLWVLLQGRFVALAVAAVVAGAMSAYTFAYTGVIAGIESWIYGVGAYQQYPVNMFGHESIMGVFSLLAVFGIDIPVMVATLIGIAVVIGFRFWGRSEPFSPMTLSILILVQMLVFSRPLDTILLAPVFALFWPGEKSHPLHFLLFFVAMALFCFPQGVVTHILPFAGVGHFRTLLLIGLAIAFFRQAFLNNARFEYRGRGAVPA